MKKSLLASFLLLSSLFSYAQSLEIIYNAQSGLLNYYRNGAEVDSPCAKKGEKITFTVTNYNNYLYNLNITDVQEERRISRGSDFMGGMQGMGFNQFADLLSPTEGSRDVDSDGVVDATNVITMEEVSTGTLSEKEMMIKQLKQSASAKLNNLANLKYDFSQATSTVKTYEREAELKGIALKEIQKLKYNPNISPAKIQNASKSILETVLKISDYTEPDLSEIMANNHQEKELLELAAAQERKRSEYTSEIGAIQNIQSELQELVPSGLGLVDTYFSIEKEIAEAPAVLEKSQATTAAVDALVKLEQSRDLSDLMALWYEYEAISSNNFSTNYLSRADGDQVVFNVAFQLKPSVADSTSAPRFIQLAPVRVPVYGRLKINASVGFSFGQFFNPPKSYFIRDSLIMGQKGDSFIPMVTSFVHFYKESQNMLSIGGSLGVGIPISGDGLESTSFFVGPSFFFGKSDRFVLNLGLIGSRVKRLAVGYKEGDFYDGDENFIPQESLYQMGYFVGLSFNLRG